MGNANFIELETCIEESILFCESHESLDFVQIHQPRLLAAKRKFYDGLTSSDARFSTWQQESIGEKLKWKHLGQKFAAVQKGLKRVNASEYPSKTVRHWDIEILEAHVVAMCTYLKTKTDSIEDAATWCSDLERALQNATSQSELQQLAFAEYARFARLRGEGLGTLNSALGDFRVSMRNHLGKTSEQYLSIRWPMSLKPDGPII